MISSGFAKMPRRGSSRAWICSINSGSSRSTMSDAQLRISSTAVDEWIGRFDPVVVLGRRRHVAGGDLPARLPVDLVGLVGRLLMRLGRRRQHVGIDEMAAPLARHQEPLIDQLLERRYQRLRGYGAYENA